MSDLGVLHVIWHTDFKVHTLLFSYCALLFSSFKDTCQNIGSATANCACANKDKMVIIVSLSPAWSTCRFRRGERRKQIHSKQVVWEVSALLIWQQNTEEKNLHLMNSKEKKSQTDGVIKKNRFTGHRLYSAVDRLYSILPNYVSTLIFESITHWICLPRTDPIAQANSPRELMDEVKIWWLISSSWGKVRQRK